MPLDTRETRRRIGFSSNRKDWAQADAHFDEHTLRIAGHPVMEDWEINYMQRLSEIASRNGGRILELGYGLGLSAKAIQAQEIADHYVIECHPDVIAKAVADMRIKIKSNTFHILTGFWEDVTPLLSSESFDGILFDTYPLCEEEIHENHFWFFREAYRLLKPGGVFTYYSDEPKDFSPTHRMKLLEAGFKSENIASEHCGVTPPEDCEYWQNDTILAPIIVK